MYIYMLTPALMIHICAFFWFGSWAEGCIKTLQCSKNPEVLGHEVHQTLQCWSNPENPELSSSMALKPALLLLLRLLLLWYYTAILPFYYIRILLH